jgi:hypothetical protein
MPRPRKKNKHLEVSFDPEKYKRETSTEDFVGHFLVGLFTAFVTALISQAVSNQINWLIVILVSVIAVVVLAIYQTRR